MSALILPFWFKQRQCQAEPQGPHLLRVFGPNLGEAFLAIRQDQGRWAAALRRTADGPDIAASEAECPNEKEAWNAAFELYRTHVIT
jgi:hypothetical protein